MENKTVETKAIKNPKNYVYTPGTKIEIDGFFLMDLITLFEGLVDDEIKIESKFKYNYVNDSGKIVKSPRPADIESGKVKKILDFNRTVIDPTMEYSITEKGIAYAELKKFLDSIHFENIRKGVAVNYQEASETMMNKEESVEN